VRGLSAQKPGQPELIEFPEPELGAGEVIVAPTVCGICSTDVKMAMRGEAEARYALGHEVVGEIIAAHPSSKWSVGQRVVAAPYLPCGSCTYCHRGQVTLCPDLFKNTIVPGGLAERIRIPPAIAARGLFAVPEGLSDEVAALSEPLGCVLKGLEDTPVASGDSVLIIGDGPMGLLMAATARLSGAWPVLVAGMTSHRLAVAENNYADAVIDVSENDLRSNVENHTQGRGADVVFVVVSSGEALTSGIQAVRAGGAVNNFAGVPEGTTVELDVRKLHYEQYHLTGSFGVGPAHMAKALRLLESERIDVGPIITARFSFEEASNAVDYAAQRIGLKALVLFDNSGGKLDG
jgi:L-iditol 2-dehydrogenase